MSGAGRAGDALTVSALNAYVKSLLDGDELLQSVAVRGEISNFVNHRSGHLYFSLKDEGGLIRAAMFRSNASRLRFRPRDGMRVVAYGTVSLYPESGAYQLYVTALLEEGIGDLHRAFIALRDKLEREGLFSPERKKPIPRYPSRIGIVTSPTGAAIRDMLRILSRRFPAAKLILYPARVQGEGAAEEIAEGIRHFDTVSPVDTIIIGRGGGSFEDLFAFNDEALARTIAEADTPIISAVGHETDFTISDFAADLRAPTPSAAAELATPDREELRAALLAIPHRLGERLRERLGYAARRLSSLEERPCLARPGDLFREREMKLLYIDERLGASVGTGLAERGRALQVALAGLEALNPLSTLSRGYAVAEKEGGGILHSAHEAARGDLLRLRLSDGALTARVETVNAEAEKNDRKNEG